MGRGSSVAGLSEVKMRLPWCRGRPVEPLNKSLPFCNGRIFGGELEEFSYSKRPFTPILTFPHQGGRDLFRPSLGVCPGNRCVRPKPRAHTQVRPYPHKPSVGADLGVCPGNRPAKTTTVIPANAGIHSFPADQLSESKGLWIPAQGRNDGLPRPIGYTSSAKPAVIRLKRNCPGPGVGSVFLCCYKVVRFNRRRTSLQCM